MVEEGERSWSRADASSPCPRRGAAEARRACLRMALDGHAAGVGNGGTPEEGRRAERLPATTTISGGSVRRRQDTAGSGADVAPERRRRANAGHRPFGVSTVAKAAARMRALASNARCPGASVPPPGHVARHGCPTQSPVPSAGASSLAVVSPLKQRGRSLSRLRGRGPIVAGRSSRFSN